MMKFDFSSKVDSFINKSDLRFYLDKKQAVLDKFNSSDMIGWTKGIKTSELDKMIEVSKAIKSHSEILVVIGIGGSFLGSYCVDKMLCRYFNNDNYEVIYAGTTLSSKYMSELLDYLKDKDFSINVISKSGTTMETNITYKLLKDLLDKKYSKDEVIKHIVMTTDKEKGALREEVNVYSYESFIIPDDIGGRYSIETAAHLFPLAFNYDIKALVKGLSEGHKYLDEAFLYACYRHVLYDKGKYVENFCCYEESMSSFSEWIKQLFGETEGKDGKGILPFSTVQTRDLHSLGQFIQEGNKIMFETFLKVNESDKLLYNDKDLHIINNIVLDSVSQAHYLGNVPSITIEFDMLCENTIGEAMYFFMMSAAFSGYLFNVNPFDQPGVEVYKKEVRENLK